MILTIVNIWGLHRQLHELNVPHNCTEFKRWELKTALKWDRLMPPPFMYYNPN